MATRPLSEKLQAVLDGDYADIRNEARTFFTQPDLLPPPAGLSMEDQRTHTFNRLLKIIAAGYARSAFDAKYGGESDPKKFMNFAEILAHNDLSLYVKQGVNFGLFGLGIANLGTEKHHAKYIPSVLDGSLLGGFAMTEMSGGSDVQSVATEAVYDHATRSFTLDTPTEAARKAFIGNAAKNGEMMVVFAQLKMSKDATETQGVHAFLVPIRDKQGNVQKGIAIEDCGHKVGLNGVDNGYIAFNEVNVPYDAMLDRFASIDADGNYKSDIQKKTARFFKMISTLVTGRVNIAIASLSASKNALATAIPFADQRVVFGNILLDLQATQTRLLPKLADTYALHFATRSLIDKHTDGAPDVETLAAALKSVSTDHAIATIDEARRVEGGHGYMADKARYGLLRDDADIFRTFEGDNTVLRLLVARNQLTDLTKSIGKSPVSQAFAAVSMAWRDKTATLGLSKGGAGHLLDAAYQQEVFAKREQAMLYDLGNKIRKKTKAAGGFRQAADLCQDDMLAYADAYAENVMIKEFVKAVDAQKDPETKAALKDLCDLFAVHTMSKNATWYIENGFMKPSKTKALAETAQELGLKLRPQAVDLIKAFAIPDALLYTTPQAAAVPAAVRTNVRKTAGKKQAPEA